VGIFNRWRALVSEASLMVYAEGTRSRDGHVAKFKAGSFLLAIEAQLPIVPVAVIGTRQVMPKGRLRTEPANVSLIVHDPIQPPILEAPTIHDARALAERVKAVVSAAVESRQFGAVGETRAI
jgi:1-acyl-sn-glycerol-3-phosphate acyltransferase